MTDQVPKTQQDLREMVYHTDARVTAMEGQLTSISHSLNRTDQKLDQVISAINTPKDINWVGLGALALSVVVSMAGAAKFMTEYISLSQAPLVMDVQANNRHIANLREFQHQTHYEFGQFHKSAEEHASDIASLWERIGNMEKIDREHDIQLSAAEVSRRAIGDYVRQIDELGSRRWMSQAPTRASQVEEGN